MKTTLPQSAKSETPESQFFYIIPQTLFDDNTVSKSELKVYARIKALKHGLRTSYKNLAGMTDVSEVTVKRAIPKLIKKGWLFKKGLDVYALSQQITDGNGIISDTPEYQNGYFDGINPDTPNSTKNSTTNNHSLSTARAELDISTAGFSLTKWRISECLTVFGNIQLGSTGLSLSPERFETFLKRCKSLELKQESVEDIIDSAADELRAQVAKGNRSALHKGAKYLSIALENGARLRKALQETRIANSKQDYYSQKEKPRSGAHSASHARNRAYKATDEKKERVNEKTVEQNRKKALGIVDGATKKVSPG